jgi:adenylyltransferase/sulfurtransferase
MGREDLEIAPEQLAERLRAGDAPVLLDVRREDEHAFCTLAGAVLIPLHELGARLDELDPAAEIVAFCHHGVRSLNATVMLRNAGFPRVRSLAGGIDLWSTRIDPSVPRY